MIILAGINKEINLNDHIESPYRLVRMEDYPLGPNTDGCEDSVEMRDGTLTWTRFAFDTGFFVTNPVDKDGKPLPLEKRLIPKPHPKFPYTTTMAYSKLFGEGWTEPKLFPFNSAALNGCQHLNGDHLYFHSENNGVKTLFKGNIKTGKLEKMPFYGDNPHLIDPNTILIDRDKDIWVARKGWFGWYLTNATDYFRAPINTQGEDVQPAWCDGKLYFCRNYKEIWMYDPKSRMLTLLAKVKGDVGGIGEPTFYKGKLYMLVCYWSHDHIYFDYDICVSQ